MSFYLMGASFVDLAFLKLDNIVDGRIEYDRKKTGRKHSIKIIPALQSILDQYTADKTGDDFILDVIKRKVSPLLYTNIQIQNEKISYQIKGHEKGFEWSLNEEMKNQLRDYPIGEKREAFLRTIIAQEETKKQYRDIHNALKHANNAMQDIGKACGISAKITSYVARHSFATIAKYKGVPIPVISQALGHADLKTTETYLAKFDHDTMDQYNVLITGD